MFGTGAGSYAYEPGLTAYDTFNERATFELQFCAWPRRCYVTRQWLFMTTAMRGRRVITGPGEPVVQERWYHQHEHLIMLLKKAQ